MLSIDHYPADQCQALCEANGGGGGASGLTVVSVPASSCTAFVTSTAAAGVERCCLYTAAVINNATWGRIVQDVSATLYLQVPTTTTGAAAADSGGAIGQTSTAGPWQCPVAQGPLDAPPLHKTLSVGPMGSKGFVVGQSVHEDGRQALMVSSCTVVHRILLCQIITAGTTFRPPTTLSLTILSCHCTLILICRVLVGWQVQNFDHTLSAMPTLTIPTATASTSSKKAQVLYEVVQQHGQQAGVEMPVEDELPTVPGLQISLDAAEARLFVLGAAPTSK